MQPLPQRRSPRLKDYDYTQAGTYFVTICAHHHACIFGEVVDETMRLNDLGLLVASYWEQIPQHYPHIELDAAVVMPNHLHGILIIVDRPEQSGHDNVVSLQYERFGRPVRGSLSTAIRTYKAAVTSAVRNAFPHVQIPVWQGRFHDHIIRNERSLNAIREYVLCNPAKWAEDKFYSSSSS